MKSNIPKVEVTEKPKATGSMDTDIKQAAINIKRQYRRSETKLIYLPKARKDIRWKTEKTVKHKKGLGRDISGYKAKKCHSKKVSQRHKKTELKPNTKDILNQPHAQRKFIKRSLTF